MRARLASVALIAIAFLTSAAWRSPAQTSSVPATHSNSVGRTELSGSLAKTPATSKASATSELPTSTALTAASSAGNYTLTATIGSSGRNGSPSGKVQFFDTTNGNALLGAGLIGGGPQASASITYRILWQA